MLCEWFTNCHIYVDAQAVLDLIARCQQANSLEELRDCAELDLVNRLWRSLRSGARTFTKIRAHQSPSAVEDPLLRYRVLGNKQANDTAIIASKHMYPNVAAQWAGMAQDLQTDINWLKQLYQLHLALHLARSQQEQLDQQQDAALPIAESRQDQLQVLRDWQVVDPRSWPTAVVDATTRSVFGPILSQGYVRWAQQLSWPSEMQPNMNDPGVTFMELALSFMMYMGCYLPVRRVKGNEAFYFVPKDATDAKACEVTLSEQGFLMAYWIHQMNQLRSPPMVPNFRSAGCKSLYRLGTTNQSKGFVCRPSFPTQSEVMQHMASLAQRYGPSLPQQTAEVNVTASIDKIRSELRDTIKAKQERVKREVQRVRRLAGSL